MFLEMFLPLFLEDEPVTFQILHSPRLSHLLDSIALTTFLLIQLNVLGKSPYIGTTALLHYMIAAVACFVMFSVCMS